MGQSPLFRVMKLLRKTADTDNSALYNTVVSGGAWSFILAVVRKRTVMVGWCQADTAVELRISNLSCTVNVVDGMFWRNSTLLLFLFCVLLFLIAVALDFAIFTISSSSL